MSSRRKGTPRRSNTDLGARGTPPITRDQLRPEAQVRLDRVTALRREFAQDRGKAAKVIQDRYRSRLARPFVYRKGQHEVEATGLNYAVYVPLNQMEKNPHDDSTSYIFDAPSHQRELQRRNKYVVKNDYGMFQKVFLPDGVSEERIVKRGFDTDFFDTVYPQQGPRKNDPFFFTDSVRLKDALNRRRRKLRDIEDGQILVRDQLFRELPPRGREHKRPRRTGQ